MKNLKKVLAVVLVVALAFSLVTFASAAKLADYSDSAKVTQKEAVDVLSQAGVLAGANGAFSPTDNFTREQAAKVIAYLMLGAKVADSLKTSTSSFSDIDPTRWSAPYIQYCATAGVINGLGDGTFGPEGNVTGTQFAKMILTALGYGKNGEYVGSAWEINTLKDAVSLEILDLNVDYTAAATREQVAQYAFNALLLNAQVWDKNTGEYIDATSASSHTLFAGKLGLTYVDESAPGVALMQSGVTGHQWNLDGIKIAFYADESLIASDATGLAVSSMTKKYDPTWSVFFKAELETGVNYFFNGAPVHVYNATTDATATFQANDKFVYGNLIYTVLAPATGAAIIADIANIATYSATLVKEYSVRGAVVNFINTDKDTKAETVSIIEKSVAVATGAPTNNYGSVKIPGLPNPANAASGTFNEAKVSYPADIQADDYLLYYTDLGSGVTYVEKAQVVTGTPTSMSSVFGVYQYNIGSKTYKSSELPGSVDGEDPAVPASYYNGGIYTAMQSYFNTELTIILDNGGNIIDFDAATNAASTANYAVVLDTASASAHFTTGVEAVLLFTDGTTKVVNLGKVGTADATLAAAAALQGQFVTYKVADDGTYNIKSTSANNPVGGSVDINRLASFIPGFTGDSETVFLIPDTSVGAGPYDYVVVKGIANAPDTVGATATGVQVVKFTTTGTAKFVFVPVTGTLATPTLENVAYIIYDGLFVNYTVFPAKDGDPQYCEYKAIVDGQATTIKVDNSAYAGYALSATPGLRALVDADKDGYIDSTTAATGAAVGTGTAKAANGIIKLGGVGYTYNADTQVFYIDAFGGVTKKTVADIGKDTDDQVTTYLTQSATDAGDLLGAIYINVK